MNFPVKEDFFRHFNSLCDDDFDFSGELDLDESDESVDDPDDESEEDEDV